MCFRGKNQSKRSLCSIVFLIILPVFVFQFCTDTLFGCNPASSFSVDDRNAFVATTSDEEDEKPAENDSKGIRRKRFFRYLTLFGPSAVTVLWGIKGWDWEQSRVWRWSQEKEWGYDSDSGGSDKFGHAFANYMIARVSYSIFDYTEDGRPTKWLYAFLTSFMVSTIIEIGDAYTDEYGFSWGDMAADFIGLGIGLFLERYPKIASILRFSCEYFPSPGFRRSKDASIYKIFTDNTGWKYMANLNLAGFNEFGLNIPKVFRYFTLDIGFFVQGYTDYDRGRGIEDKRCWFVGISLNLADILRKIFKKKGPLLRQVIPGIFTYYHVPLGVRKKMFID